MTRKSEFSSYVFIKNELCKYGWNTRNPSRGSGGQLYTQQECLDEPRIAEGLVNRKPEYVVKINESLFWVIEAKARHEQMESAVSEAIEYARLINQSNKVVKIATGVAGTDEDGYLVENFFIARKGSFPVRYNGKKVTSLLTKEQIQYLVENETSDLNELVSDESLLLDVAEEINEVLHSASINKDIRASVVSSVLLSMVSDTIPNMNATADVLIKDINNRAEDVLIQHSKREFAEYIELKLPQETASKEKYKAAVVKTFFLLRKINVYRSHFEFR